MLRLSPKKLKNGWPGYRSKVVRNSFRRCEGKALVEHPLPKGRLTRRGLLFGICTAATLTAAHANTPFSTWNAPIPLPNGTGSTTTPMPIPKLVGVVANVQAFGAVGDGVHDDQPNIQAAIQWITSSRAIGTVYFPYPTVHYLIGSSIVPPTTAAPIGATGQPSFRLLGEPGASIVCNFNGFAIDGYANPYVGPAGSGIVIETLNVQNAYAGQNWNVTATASWSAGSNVTINASGLNSQTATNCLVYINDGRLAQTPILVGTATAVNTGTGNITVGTALVGSSSISNLNLAIVQGYAAAANWNGAGSGTISSYTYNSGTGLVTLTMSSPISLSTNNAINVSSLNIAGLNGAFTVAAPVSSSTTVTYTGPTGQAGTPSGGGSLSWSGAAQITMSGSPPTGVPAGALVYDFNRIQFGDGTISNVWTMALGIGTWTGSALPINGGASQGGTAGDVLVFAPLAGAIRLSSWGDAAVQHCSLSGFYGIQCDESNVNPSQGQTLDAVAFNITIQGCDLSSAAGNAAAIGSTGVHMCENSSMIQTHMSGFWCAVRLDGFACNINGGQFEVNTYGIVFGAEQNISNIVSVANQLYGFSMESNIYSIVQASGCGACNISAVDINCQNNGQIAVYLAGGNTTIQDGKIGGNVAQYGIYIPDSGGRTQIKLSNLLVLNNANPANAVRTPTTFAGWGKCENVFYIDNSGNFIGVNPTYLYSQLPGVGANPPAFEGEEYTIRDAQTADCSDSACNWGANVTLGGGSLHRKVYYNNANWTVEAK